MKREQLTVKLHSNILTLAKQYKATQPRKKLWQICEEALIEYLEKRGVSVKDLVGYQEKNTNQ